MKESNVKPKENQKKRKKNEKENGKRFIIGSRLWCA
jgi:hypothetical protein